MKKSLLIKRISVLFFIICSFFQVGLGQVLLVENFDYVSGALLTSNGWTAHSGGGTNPIDVIVPGLTYSGYPGSNIGGAAQLDNSGEDVNKSFTSQTSGSVYVAFLINVTSTTTGGDYFLNVIESPSSTYFKGRIWIKQGTSPSKFYIGVAKTGTTPAVAYSANEYDAGTTYLLVLKYQFNTGSTSDDVVTLYVEPSPLASEPASPTVTAADNTTTDGASVTCVALRQGTTATIPKLNVDGIRVATNWTDAISDNYAPAPAFNPANAATGVLANAIPTITFDESILKTDGSVVSDADLASLITFKETDASGAAVAFTATIDAGKKVITVTPSATLKSAQAYYLAVGPVEDAAGNESTLKSAVFTTIAANTPTITLVYPNGGEKLYSGDQATITWTTTNFDAAENVKIEVYLPDAIWYTIEASTPNDGSQIVMVGPNADYGTAYLIRVSGVTNGVADESDNPFTIIATSDNLADLRSYDVNSIIKYTGAATVTYARTSNNQKYIQDATAAILIHDPSNYVGAYAAGSGITNVEGKLTLYNGLLQLVPQAATGQTATGPAITPEPVNITDLTSDDQCKLVKLSAVKLATTSGTWASGANYPLDGISNSFVIRTAFNEADYIGSPVPGGFFDAVVLVGQYNAVIQVTPRNAADITVYSSQKAITSFVFASFDPDVTGRIDETLKSVALTVPSGTDVTTLSPTITVSANASVSPASGVATNFTSPVIYTVTAQDGSTQTYEVTVSFISGIERTSAGNIRLYPVPATSILNVSGVPNLKSVEILDLAGKVISSVTTSTDEVIRIPVSNLRQGTYLLRFNTKDGKIIKKFVR